MMHVCVLYKIMRCTVHLKIILSVHVLRYVVTIVIISAHVH